MTRLFPPSQIDHPWRQTFSILAISVWVYLAACWLLEHPMMWLLRLLGPIDWGATVST